MEKQGLLEDQRRAEQEPEPSLSELQMNVRKAHRAYIQAWSRTTSGKWHRRIMYSVTAMLILFMFFCVGVLVDEQIEEDGQIPSWTHRKVQLEAHIMSKCPDAKDCLHDMILPAMQNVSDKVNFTLSFIGSVDEEDQGGVRCKHGDDECMGNMIELCAAQLYPDPKIYLGFTMCLTRDYPNIPERQLVEDCALEHSIPMWKLEECLSSNDGRTAIEMLQSSFNRTVAAGVTKSCTVRLDGKIRCVRDGGRWYDCEGGSRARDLVADIEELAALE